MTTREFQERIWPLKDRFYRFALRWLGDSQEAQDVVQEAMIKIWGQGDELQRVGNLEAWCLRLVRNLSIDKSRGGYRKRRTELTEAPAPYSDSQSPNQYLQAKDTLQHIEQLMQELPLAQRAVMQLRDIEGLSYQEIAEVLDISMAQVKTNLHRARVRIREAYLKTESYGL